MKRTTIEIAHMIMSALQDAMDENETLQQHLVENTTEFLTALGVIVPHKILEATGNEQEDLLATNHIMNRLTSQFMLPEEKEN